MMSRVYDEFGEEGLVEERRGGTFFGLENRYLPRGECFEGDVAIVAALGREELERRIKNFNGSFKLDFTQDYLKELSVDRLRHILLAALLHVKK